MLTINEVARLSGVSYWTVRRYGQAGVFDMYRTASNRLVCDADAVEKAKAHHKAHGAPGGRPLRHVG